MKLRNKKTGKIVEFRYLQSDYVAPLVLTTYKNDKPEMYSYNSLTELNEEWEDYEEQKEYYCIDWTEPNGIYKTKYEDVRDEFNKEVGNYFDTREEAEKAVRKLKAWKRLKDKGLTFCAWKITDDGCSVDIETTLDAEVIRAQQKYITDDLNLLFGGEE